MYYASGYEMKDYTYESRSPHLRSLHAPHKFFYKAGGAFVGGGWVGRVAVFVEGFAYFGYGDHGGYGKGTHLPEGELQYTQYLRAAKCAV